MGYNHKSTSAIDLTHIDDSDAKIIIKKRDGNTFQIPVSAKSITPDLSLTILTNLLRALTQVANNTIVTVYVGNTDFLYRWDCRFIPSRMKAIDPLIKRQDVRYADEDQYKRRVVYKAIDRHRRAHGQTVYVVLNPAGLSDPSAALEPIKVHSLGTARIPVSEVPVNRTAPITSISVAPKPVPVKPEELEGDETDNYSFGITVEPATSSWKVESIQPKLEDVFTGSEITWNLAPNFKEDYLFICAVKGLLQQFKKKGNIYITCSNRRMLREYENGYMSIRYEAPVTREEHVSHMRLRGIYIQVIKLARVSSRKLFTLYPTEVDPSVKPDYKSQLWLQTGKGVVAYKSIYSDKEVETELQIARHLKNPYMTSLNLFEGTIFPDEDDAEKGFVYRFGYLCRYYKPQPRINVNMPPGHTPIVSYGGPGTFFDMPIAFRVNEYFDEQPIPGSVILSLDTSSPDVTIDETQSQNLIETIEKYQEAK